MEKMFAGYKLKRLQNHARTAKRDVNIDTKSKIQKSKKRLQYR